MHDDTLRPDQWDRIPARANRTPVPDERVYRLVHNAMEVLTPAERLVIELAYGFRGDPKSDAEVAHVLGAPRVTASKRRERALEKLRAVLVEYPE